METTRKAKRVVEQEEALQPETVQYDPSIPPEINTEVDPILRDLLGPGPTPECTPPSAMVLTEQSREKERQRRQAALLSEDNGKNGTWVFVKNMNPREQITLLDGTPFQFPPKTNIFICKDEALAKQLIAVAERHYVVLK